MYKVSIIGGTSGFGKWLAEFAMENFAEEIDLVITGRNIEKGEMTAKQIGCSFTNDSISAVRDSDVVIFSVPIDKTLQTIKDLCPYIKSGAIVGDVTSVKIGPSEYMKKYSNKDVLIIPTHPVFGPFVKNINGQVVVLTADDDISKDKRYLFLLDFLKEKGFKTIQTTPQEHDKMMSIIQGLTSFTLFVMGQTLLRMNVDMDLANQFTSPIYKVMTGMIGRYMHQNPGLYADIQMDNELTLSVQQNFIASANNFNKIVENKDKESFIQNVEDISKFLGANAKKGQNYTDKLIYLYAKQSEKLKENIGKNAVFENVYSKEKMQGFLEGFDENCIFLDGKICLDIQERIIY